MLRRDDPGCYQVKKRRGSGVTQSLAQVCRVITRCRLATIRKRAQMVPRRLTSIGCCSN